MSFVPRRLGEGLGAGGHNPTRGEKMQRSSVRRCEPDYENQNVWCGLKARCTDTAGACNDVTFIRLIRVERSIFRPGDGHYYLISNAIAYLITPAICIHRRVVGRESFARDIIDKLRGRESTCVDAYHSKITSAMYFFISRAAKQGTKDTKIFIQSAELIDVSA